MCGVKEEVEVSMEFGSVVCVGDPEMENDREEGWALHGPWLPIFLNVFYRSNETPKIQIKISLKIRENFT